MGSKFFKTAIVLCSAAISICGTQVSAVQDSNNAQEKKKVEKPAPPAAERSARPRVRAFTPPGGNKGPSKIFSPEAVARNTMIDKERIKKSLELARAKAPPIDSDAIREADKMPIGSALQICDGCPIFVKVPAPPNDLRPVQYVSKYELTWNNYLTAIDDGVCPAPDFHGSRPSHYEGDIADHLDAFRLDWPITQLNLAKIKCYMEWLNIKSGRKFALPTADEWEWFARAGKADIKFPWGNNPEDGNGAFRSNKNIEPQQYDDDPYANRELAKRLGINTKRLWELRLNHIVGTKVGQYTPNKWGLYDLMGNYSELTSTQRPSIRNSKRVSYMFKGDTFYSRNWHEISIDDEYWATDLGVRFSIPIAVRFVIVSEGK